MTNTERQQQHDVDRLHGLLGIPPTRGNEVRVLRNGDEIFPAMLDAIRSATKTIDFVTFVYWSGDIAVEFLPDNVTGSPIVGESYVFKGFLALTYTL